MVYSETSASSPIRALPQSGAIKQDVHRSFTFPLDKCKSKSLSQIKEPKILAGHGNDEIEEVSYYLLAQSQEEQCASADEVENSIHDTHRESHECPKQQMLKIEEADMAKSSKTKCAQYGEETKEVKVGLKRILEEVKNLKCEVHDLKRKRGDAVSAGNLTSNGQPSSSYHSTVVLLEISATELALEKVLGKGVFGIVYQALLHLTPVAVKVLQSHHEETLCRFHQQVDVLSKVIHPNLVKILGACWERGALVYEFFPNGSLEDHLSRRRGTRPLAWQARIRIAAEICSALISLHSNKPHSIVHGDLKPSNVLLDENLVSKLSDFGMYNLLRESSTSTSCQADLKRMAICPAPEYLLSMEVSPQTDVYCFGIILLRLLTGKPPLGIAREVESALQRGFLQRTLDSTAGYWPFEEARQLAVLGLICCSTDPEDRPDLYGEVWKVIAPMASAVWAESLASHMWKKKHGCCLSWL